MDGNSPKPTETGLTTVLTLQTLEEWLALEGGNSRNANAMRALTTTSLRAAKAGHPLPLEDRDKLRWLVRDIEADTSEAPLSRWLPTKDLQTWWQARSASRLDYFQTRGLSLIPELLIQDGGGRGNATRYRFDLTPLPAPQTSQSIDQALSGDGITYQSEPAQPVFWLRWFMTPGHNPINTWRGLLIVLFVLAVMGLIPMLGILALGVLNHPGPTLARDVQSLIILSIIGYGVYRFIRPWWHLPRQRITIASDFMLASNQLHGQLQLVRDKERKITGTISLLRYHAICICCGGTVDLDNGGQAFPGRIIGRCGDSPLEHVYSFDVVLRNGERIRQPFP